MNLAEQVEGKFRIYAAAIDAEGGAGFYAAVVVRPWPTSSMVAGRETFRDERLEDGSVWKSAESALRFALQVGVAAVRAQRVFAAHLVLALVPTARSRNRHVDRPLDLEAGGDRCDAST